jgi:DNA-binding phage protein
MSARAPKIGKPKLKLRVITCMVNGKKKNKPLGEFSVDERQYFRDLHKMIDNIFAEAASQYDWTWNQLASNAGLSSSTVAKLGDRETRWPRFLTIYRLAKAVGWELVIREVKTARKGAALKVG